MQTDTMAPAIPAHVPPDLFWDHSLAEFNNQLDDPFLAASRLLDGPPLFYARDAVQGRPGWVIARHALLKEAFMDWEHFSAAKVAWTCRMMLGVDWNLNPGQHRSAQAHPISQDSDCRSSRPRPSAIWKQAVRDTCDDADRQIRGPG